MKNSVFPYPGGKTRLCDWVIRNMPDHRMYVEVFGGSAAVLLNKPRSESEVYNDFNGDLVTFFEVLRDRPDELDEWLRDTPYSRGLYERIADYWFDDVRGDDEVARAGKVYYLAHTSFGAKLHTKAGFARSTTTRDQATSYYNGMDDLQEFSDRFTDVLVEHMDWVDLLDLYDDEDVLFYLDPPYIGTESRVGGDGFDHDKLGEILPSLEAEWILSYGDRPSWADDFEVLDKAYNYSIDSGGNEGEEFLIMPDDDADFLEGTGYTKETLDQVWNG